MILASKISSRLKIWSSTHNKIFKLRNSLEEKVAVLHWKFRENEEEYWKYETQVLCRMDQISFQVINFLQFSLDWEKIKVLWRTYSQILCCGHFPNCPIVITKLDLFQLNHDGKISQISYFSFRFCNQSKLYGKSFCNHFFCKFLFVVCIFKRHKSKRKWEIRYIGRRLDIEGFSLRM